MAGEVTVDALPYFDKGYDDPGVREAATAMVEEETRRYRPTRNYLNFLAPPNIHAFETDIMKNEFERLEARQPMELLSMRRYDLPIPPSGQRNDITAWEECVKNSHAQLQHQDVRIENLNLMLEHGSNAWRLYNEQLVAMLQDAQKQLQSIKKDIQDVNWERKSEQTKAGEKLRTLEANWVNLVSKNYEIEEAIFHLEVLAKTENAKMAQSHAENGKISLKVAENGEME
uniref:pre-mRNA-splicing factor SPF27 n=1 Tax=Ciona intestinalis TaxID=7719 RepID=UPI000180B822|nr:pre-mRNA-splicing factor SPF27 [Ciona intestinalis]|eukprot:XP_002128040.1 pre-mRNA-splicing factor SPF27 [Ciona intestinalis]